MSSKVAKENQISERVSKHVKAGEAVPTHKRRYSRKGCVQCKKRKLKCDESKPQCANCLRAKKECSYKQIAKFSKSRTFTPNDRVFLAFESEKKEREKFKSDTFNDRMKTKVPLSGISESSFQFNDVDLDLQEKSDSSGMQSSNDAFDNCVKKVREKRDSSISREKDTKTKNLPSQFFDPKMKTDSVSSSLDTIFDTYQHQEDILINDVTILAHSLNDTAMIDEFNDCTQKIHSSKISTINSRPPTQLHEDNADKISNLIASYDVIPEHKNYLRLFFEKYSIWLFPFASGKNNVCYNILMSQALEFPFLLDAILSMTARYENFSTSNPVDAYYQKYYFVMCCKGFTKIFEDKTKISKYVEPLILTTLLLVTDSVAYMGGDWRAHLKAAHNLFCKYVDIYKKRSNSILLSTIWFAAFEILAVLSNPFGGTITSAEDFDIMMNAGVTSKDNRSGVELGLILPCGYNIFLGYSAEAISMFITFVRITLRIRQSKSQRVSSDDLCLLFSKIYEAGNYHLASEDCLIPKCNPYHPNNHTGMLLPIATYGYTNQFIFSWFDISHKVHVDALHLKILVDKHFLNMPETSEIVQSLVKKIIDTCHFFLDIDFENSEFNLEEEIKKNERVSIWLDRRLVTVHWPLLTCGLLCTDEVDKLKIEFYFRCLIRMGARSLERSFKNLVNKWQGGTGVCDYVPFV